MWSITYPGHGPEGRVVCRAWMFALKLSANGSTAFDFSSAIADISFIGASNNKY
jgi:hypothetical protein